MKKIIIAMLMLGSTVFISIAQTPGAALKTLFTRFDTTSSTSVMISMLPQWDELEQKNPTDWACHFYPAYARIKLSLKIVDKILRDKYLDAADASLLKACALAQNNEEILILQAYSAKARIAVDPGGRWKRFGDIYSGLIAQAKKMGPVNPRIYFLDGMEPFWKPGIWGGGKGKAKPYFEKAKALFSKENRSDIMKPYWGEAANEEFLKQCGN